MPMSQTTQVETRKAAEIVREAQVSQFANGVCYAAFGETGVSLPDLERIIGVVPPAISTARAYCAKARSAYCESLE